MCTWFSSHSILYLSIFAAKKVLDSCSFRDEDDDCTYHYTAEDSKDPAVKDLLVQVLKKKGEHLYLSPLVGGLSLNKFSLFFHLVENLSIFKTEKLHKTTRMYFCCFCVQNRIFQEFEHQKQISNFAVGLPYNFEFLKPCPLLLQIALLPASCGCSLFSCSSCCCWHFCCSAAGNTVPPAKRAARYFNREIYAHTC